MTSNIPGFDHSLFALGDKNLIDRDFFFSPIPIYFFQFLFGLLFSLFYLDFCFLSFIFLLSYRCLILDFFQFSFFQFFLLHFRPKQIISAQNIRSIRFHYRKMQKFEQHELDTYNRHKSTFFTFLMINCKIFENIEERKFKHYVTIHNKSKLQGS